MSIVTKGPFNVYVIERNSVPVVDVCDHVSDHKTIEWLQTRYNITLDEIFECLDMFLDLTDKQEFKIDIECYKDNETNKIFGIETKGINDKSYFSVLTYGRIFFPDILDFKTLYVYSLNLIIIEALISIKENSNFESEENIHSAVLNAFIKSYGPIDSNLVEEMLNQLDYNDILDKINHDKN